MSFTGSDHTVYSGFFKLSRMERDHGGGISKVEMKEIISRREHRDTKEACTVSLSLPLKHDPEQGSYYRLRMCVGDPRAEQEFQSCDQVHKCRVVEIQRDRMVFSTGGVLCTMDRIPPGIREKHTVLSENEYFSLLVNLIANPSLMRKAVEAASRCG